MNDDFAKMKQRVDHSPKIAGREIGINQTIKIVIELLKNPGSLVVCWNVPVFERRLKNYTVGRVRIAE